MNRIIASCLILLSSGVALAAPVQPSPALKAVLECRQEDPAKIVSALKGLKGISLNKTEPQALKAPLVVLGEPVSKLFVSIDQEAGEGSWSYELKQDFGKIAKHFKLSKDVITLPDGFKQANTFYNTTSLTIEQSKTGTKVSCGFGA